MNVAVVGSRNISLSLEETFRILSDFLPDDMKKTDNIISGGAYGVDSHAAAFAKHFGYGLIEYLPNYKVLGRKAPLARNHEIVNAADFLIALWDGRSRGTYYTMRLADEKGIPFLVYNVKDRSGVFYPPKKK